MKFTINEEDLNKIVGRFIIQINSDKPSFRLTDRDVDLSFYFAKRIKFVSFGGEGIIASDLYGNTHTKTIPSFIKVFNNYEYEHMREEEKGKRYHRLLYGEELELVFNFIRQRNYGC